MFTGRLWEGNRAEEGCLGGTRGPAPVDRGMDKNQSPLRCCQRLALRIRVVVASMARAVLLLALLMLGGSVQALNSILPPESLGSNYSANFGCGIATDGSRLAVYSPKIPQREGVDSWTGLTFNTKPDSNGYELESTFVTPDVSGSAFLGESEPCVIAIRNPYVAVGEPWAHNNRGRVILRYKVTSPTTPSETDIVGQGQKMNDRYGESVSFADRWIVVGSPGADAIIIYELTDTGFVEHTRLEGADFGGVDTTSLSIGHSVSVSDRWLVVGAPSTPGFVVDGMAFVYVYSDTADQWSLYQVLRPSYYAYGATFGTIVQVGLDHVYVSSPGTSTNTGTVSLYRHNSQRMFLDYGAFSGTERGDEFGRALAGTASALAVSQTGTSSKPTPNIHVYLKCGDAIVNLIHIVVSPDEGDSQWDYKWGRSLAWAPGKLLIGASGRIDTWNIPSIKAGSCGGSVGSLQPPSCCFNGSNVVLSHSSQGIRIPDSSGNRSSDAYITAPVRMYERVIFDSSAVLRMESSGSIAVDGSVKFAGKLKFRLALPTSSASIHINHLMTYTSHQGAFEDVEIIYTSPASSCDRTTVLPVYAMDGLSLVISFTKVQCNGKTHTILLILSIVGFLVVLLSTMGYFWFPKIRQCFTASSEGVEAADYRHTRLATSEEEAEDGLVNELSDAYASYPEDGYDLNTNPDDDGKNSDPELDFH